MSLKSEIETVRDAALARLADAHDYFAFTAGASRTLQQLVERRRLDFSLENPATGSQVTAADFALRSQGYIANDLAKATLQQFVSIFETFLFDALRLWLTAYPHVLAKRQLTGEDILALPDKSAIVDALVVKELTSVLYDRPTGWFRYLNDRVALGLPSEAEIQQFAEVKATRDVLVHGQSVANAQYVDKAGSLARAGMGARLDVPVPYHRASWTLLRKLTADIGSGLAGKA